MSKQSHDVIIALQDGNRCQDLRERAARPMFLGMIDGFERGGLSRCRITALPTIRGEAFSPAGRDRWVVLTQGTGVEQFLSPRSREIEERIGLALEAEGASRSITISARAASSFSQCVELESASTDEHAFFCEEGRFIFVDREVATR